MIQQDCNRKALNVVGACALGMLLATGCASRPAEISGQVTYRGKPLTHGTVTFFCKDGQIFSGPIGTDGTYHIPNVPLGAARVVVKTYPPIPPGFHLPQQLPPSKDAPKLEISDPRDKATSPAKYVSIPERYGNPDQSGLTLEVRERSQTFDIQLTP